jgi:aspartate/methionine/tyrosine aminotransferase
VYRRRLALLQEVLAAVGVEAPLPDGGFYLWAPAPDGDAWSLAEALAARLGIVVTPGDTFGPAGRRHVRLAAVQPDERLALVADRARAPG